MNKWLRLGTEWGVVCGDGWGTREAVVACRHLGLHHAASGLVTSVFGGADRPRLMSGVECAGDEKSLLQCQHDEDLWCPGKNTLGLI